jgi:transcriptional regulator with XRE-family HTH domain
LVGWKTYDVRIGTNLARMRTARRLSQAELAENVGVAQQTIAKIEKGTRPLKYAEALRICRALKLPIAFLAEEERHTASSAALLTETTEMRSFANELGEFADHLAPRLVQLAYMIALINSGSDEDQPARYHYDNAISWLQTDWGELLNERLMSALSAERDISAIRPDLSADTYGEVLGRITQLNLKEYVADDDAKA